MEGGYDRRKSKIVIFGKPILNSRYVTDPSSCNFSRKNYYSCSVVFLLSRYSLFYCLQEMQEQSKCTTSWRAGAGLKSALEKLRLAESGTLAAIMFGPGRAQGSRGLVGIFGTRYEAVKSGVGEALTQANHATRGHDILVHGALLQHRTGAKKLETSSRVMLWAQYWKGRGRGGIQMMNLRSSAFQAMHNYLNRVTHWH